MAIKEPYDTHLHALRSAYAVHAQKNRMRKCVDEQKKAFQFSLERKWNAILLRQLTLGTHEIRLHIYLQTL